MPEKKSYPKYTINLGKDENGKRITKTFYGKSKREAKKKADEYLYHREHQEASDSLGSVAKKYLETDSDTTRKYRIEVFTNVLGKRSISEINACDIEAVLRQVAIKNPREDKPTTTRTLTRYLQALNQVFKYAMANRMITFNPCDYVKVPQSVPSKERKALTIEEIALVEQSVTRGTLPALIMIYCGLRRGELAALTWNDVNLNEGTISVTRAYNYQKKEFKSTKSEAGIRMVPIPEMLLKRLKSAYKGNKKSPVIANKGKMLSASNWKHYLDELNKATGLEFTWHCCRHTYATLLYDADIGVKEAQALLGHSSARVTMDIYTHLSRQKKTSAAEKLNTFLESNADNLQTKSS